MAPINRHERRKRAKVTRKARSLPVRQDRVDAFCDWIETLPTDPPFWTHPDFAQFADLTDGELMAAQLETGERAEDAKFRAKLLRSLAGSPEEQAG